MILQLTAGGASPLNFRVTGGATAPDNPIENTIWVKTDIPITAWVFSAQVPQNPAEGMVHFATGSAAVAEFNALKENDLRVYPTGCMQYTGGAWAVKEAMLFSGGQWLSWVLYLYDRGVFYDVAGNLMQTGTAASSGLTGNVPGIAGTCTIEVGESFVAVKGIGNKSVVAHFEKAIDLTPYKTLVFQGSTSLGQYSQGVAVGVWTAIGAVYTDGLVASLRGAMAEGEHILDISNLTGKHIIGFWVSSALEHSQVKLSQLYLK